MIILIQKKNHMKERCYTSILYNGAPCLLQSNEIEHAHLLSYMVIIQVFNVCHKMFCWALVEVFIRRKITAEEMELDGKILVLLHLW